MGLPARLISERTIATCVCRKLDSAILMMKPAKNRSGCDRADALDIPMNRSVYPTRPAPSQHNNLLPQRQNLGLERCAWPEQIDDNPQNYPEEIKHPGRGSSDSAFHANMDGICDRDRALRCCFTASSHLLLAC